MSETRESTRGRIVAIQAIALVALVFVAFRADLGAMWRTIISNPDAAHALVLPLLVGLFIRLRPPPADALARGSGLGLVLLLAAVGLYVVSTWPFNYGYPRRLALIPATAGVIICLGGWRLLVYATPLVLLLLLAIPLSSRYYAFLVIKPEQLTMQMGAILLDLLPGASTYMDNNDLRFIHKGQEGLIGIGETHPGVSMLFPMLTIVVFMTFIRARPMWQVIAMAIVAVPIVLFCNLVRLLCAGALTIYVFPEPTSSMARVISLFVCLVLAFLLFAISLLALDRVIIAEEPAGEETVT